ncbi:MAG: hydrogenase iron-sulfur subunit [Desulfomonile tiedjei]|nr:hydrogenase iron-sulfur subunit [Desulfomonile tiedjei]
MKTPVEQPIPLGGAAPPEERNLRKVLVLGGDRVGLELAERLAAEGFEVVLLGQAQNGSGTGGVTFVPHGRLSEVRGFLGGFDVTLSAQNGRIRERIGHIIAAAPAEVAPKFSAYGLSRTDGALALSEFPEWIARSDPSTSRDGKWFHAAFLCGLEAGSHPAVFSRVLDAVEQLGQLQNVQTYVFTRHLKVAGADLERRYRESRERGTLYFKFDEQGCAFEQTPEGVKMVFSDPLLGREMELSPNLLVVDEDLLPPASLEPLLRAIPASPAGSPFLQPESTRFCGVETAKAGIYAVGPSRGVFAPDLIVGDVEAVVAALRKPLSEPAPWTGLSAPEVDPEKCTMCLTCVRICPHGAMGFRDRALADPFSCVRCGICAAECPMKAIVLLGGVEGNETKAQVDRDLARVSAPGKIVAFLCSRSATDALESAGIASDHLSVVKVPCAGTVSTSHILTALREGARGVLVAGCFKGNCASVYGTALASERVAEITRVLGSAGIDPARVQYAPVASNTPGTLARAVRELEESLV